MLLPVIPFLFWAFVRLSSPARAKRTGRTRPNLSVPSTHAFSRQISPRACASPLAGRLSFSAIPKQPTAASTTPSNHRERFCTLPSAVAGNRNPHYATAWPTDAVNVGNTLHGRAIVSPRAGGPNFVSVIEPIEFRADLRHLSFSIKHREPAPLSSALDAIDMYLSDLLPEQKSSTCFLFSSKLTAAMAYNTTTGVEFFRHNALSLLQAWRSRHGSYFVHYRGLWIQTDSLDACNFMRTPPEHIHIRDASC